MSPLSRQGTRHPWGKLHIVQLAVAVGVRRAEDGLHLWDLDVARAVGRHPGVMGADGKLTWLVVEPYPSEQYEFVNWDDYSQYMGK